MRSKPTVKVVDHCPAMMMYMHMLYHSSLINGGGCAEAVLGYSAVLPDLYADHGAQQGMASIVLHAWLQCMPNTC
jgi:hypothetical protein